MMGLVLTVTAVALALAAAGAIIRIARGPSLLDRVLAADVLLAILGAALCIDMAVNRHLNNLMLVVAMSVIGFIGSVTVARFVADRREQPMSPEPNAVDFWIDAVSAVFMVVGALMSLAAAIGLLRFPGPDEPHARRHQAPGARAVPAAGRDRAADAHLVGVAGAAGRLDLPVAHGTGVRAHGGPRRLPHQAPAPRAADAPMNWKPWCRKPPPKPPARTVPATARCTKNSSS
jgi:multicomponent Na+:H+ antiporter subunit F